MIKLLRAGIFRLKKEVLFWVFIFLTIGLVVFTLLRYMPNEGTRLDDLINQFIMYIGIFIAIFVSIFVGKEHSEGIIRNKIIVGHNRSAIFFTNLIISVIVSIFCEMIFIILTISMGIPLYGYLQMPLSQFAMTIFDTILVIIAFCSIYNFIAMICSDTTISTTICMLLFIIMFIAQSAFEFTASSRKYINNTFTDENGNSYIISQEPNPNYPGEKKVKIAKTIYLLIPQGQAMEIENNNIELLHQMPIYSITLICSINLLGIYIFSKRELK